MDFIYSRLNNNLVDINRIESITLLKCEEIGIPLPELNIGDYYLKVTVVDSDKVNYCDLSDLNDDEKELADKIYEEQQRAIGREDTIENTSANNLTFIQDEQTGIITITLYNIHGDVLDTKELDLETEKIIRSITLDQENKQLVFTLVDGTIITCDISELIDDYDAKITALENELNSQVSRLEGLINDEQDRAEGAEQDLQTALDAEESRATTEEARIEEKLDQEIQDRETAVSNEATTRQNADTTLQANLTAEEERAIGQETILSQNISAEINDRIGADLELSGKIADEKSRAQNAESILTTNLNSEISARQSAIIGVQNNLNQEIQDRITAVTNEQTRAEAVESVLQDNVDAEAGIRADEIERVEGLISAEETRASTEESRLDSVKADKVGPLPSYEVSLNDNIEQFVTENNLDSGEAIILKIPKRQNVPTHTYLANILYYGGGMWAVEFEMLGYQSSNRFVGYILSHIFKDLTFGDILSSDTYRQDYEENNNKVTSLTASSTNVQYPSAKAVYDSIKAEQDRAETAEGTLTTSLGDEITRAESAEVTLQGNIDAEELRAKGVEQTLDGKIDQEIQDREAGDQTLQTQIDAITVSSDVADILGTYQDLLNYDTSHLSINSIIKVLQDSTHSGAMSYYRWTTNGWEYIGSEGPFYTKTETNDLLDGLQNNIDSEALTRQNADDALDTRIDALEDLVDAGSYNSLAGLVYEEL